MTHRIHYPYGFDGRGHTRTDDRDAWIRGLIEQILFTAPGERVMRPDFGCGLRELLFAPNSPELAATTQFLVQGALQQWLEDLVVVQGVTVEAEDARLTVTVQYNVIGEDQDREDSFSLGAGP